MFLGIDLGTSSVKALLLDAQHRVVATADAPLGMSRPHPHWSEQHPHHWWAALDIAIRELTSRAPQALAEVRGIGLSGQMHGAVVLDERREVLRPAILWRDIGLFTREWYCPGVGLVRVEREEIGRAHV